MEGNQHHMMLLKVKIVMALWFKQKKLVHPQITSNMMKNSISFLSLNCYRDIYSQATKAPFWRAL